MLFMNRSPGGEGQEGKAPGDDVLHIEGKSVSYYTLDAISPLSKNGRLVLRSSGRFIPTAVSVANIVTEEMLKGSSHVEKILLDTESEPGIGRMTSTIEIFLENKKPGSV